MELKYYLRGLGLGIVVTALIMGVALPGKKTMTDEEVIARAKQLGMIEDTVLTADTSEEETEVTDEVEKTEESDDATVEEIANEQPLTEEEPEEAPFADEKFVDELPIEELEALGQPEEEQNVEETTEKVVEADEVVEADVSAEATEATEAAEEEMITSGANMTITISSGDGSYTVSKKLADVGAVSSAEVYDKFLCQNGYDKKIRTGTYIIPADASDEQMARIITGVE
ncbi:MAG: hypothetical protein IJO97_07145 [Lachnospiraceae bacterium]|nr:hypothetical protein [Lachnospiraceae bacterium]